MSKDLSELAEPVTMEEWPKVRCPECVEGALAFHSRTVTFDRGSTELVDLAKRNLAGRDELAGAFTGLLRCDNYECGRDVVIAGDWAELWGFDDDKGDVLFESFRVRYMNPAPALLLTPVKTPKKVVSAIATASALVWISPDSAATQLRLAVEELLTALHVRRLAKGTRKRLTAHDRIAMLGSTHKNVSVSLEAVKWIGNSGTHESGLSVPDVLKGAKLLEHALRSLYDTSEAQLRATARAINKRKGLPAKRKS